MLTSKGMAYFGAGDVQKSIDEHLSDLSGLSKKSIV